MENIVKSFTLKMKLHKVNVPPVYQCALLVGLLKRKGFDDAKVQNGYISFNNQAMRHYWVKCNGKDIDVVTDIAVRYGAPPIPLQLETSVSEDTEVLKQNDWDTLYELYTTDQKEFWKQRPAQLKSFKC